MTTATADVVTDTVAILLAAGWTRRWPSCANALAAPDEGGTVSLHHGEDSIRVEVEAAATTLVETLHLDPTAGAGRLARIIAATV